MKLHSSITVEWRAPRNQDEKGTFGMTIAEPGRAIIFVNAFKNRNRQEFLDTLMHEFYHAAVGLYKFSTKQEEKIARVLGSTVRLHTKYK